MTTPPNESDDPDEPVTLLHVDPEDDLPVAADEEVATEMVDAARAEREYPADETNEG
jgi:hypothetical protein